MKQSERDVNTTMAGVGRVGAMKVVMGRRGGGGGGDCGAKGGELHKPTGVKTARVIITAHLMPWFLILMGRPWLE